MSSIMYRPNPDRAAALGTPRPSRRWPISDNFKDVKFPAELAALDEEEEE